MDEPGQVFRPGDWSVGDSVRNVLLALPAVVVLLVPTVVVSVRGQGLATTAVVAVVSLGGALVLGLLHLRFRVRPSRVVVTDEAVELWRDASLRRRATLGPGTSALVFHSEARGNPVGPRQLAVTDGQGVVRLQDGRWVDQHDAVLRAADLWAVELDHRSAMERHPEVFAWWERHPNAAAVGGGLVLILGGALALGVGRWLLGAA